MNALELQNAIREFAKTESLSFKEAFNEIKEVNSSLKFIKIRSPLIKSVTLSVVGKVKPIPCTVKGLLSILSGLNPTFEENNGLVSDATLQSLTIDFVDGSSRTYTSRSTSSSRSPCQEICANIDYLVKNKFNTAW